MTSYSSKKANPRNNRINPHYPAAVGLAAVLLLGSAGCKRGILASPGGDIAAPIGSAEPVVPEAATKGEAPALYHDASVPEPTAKGDIARPFDAGVDVHPPEPTPKGRPASPFRDGGPL